MDARTGTGVDVGVGSGFTGGVAGGTMGTIVSRGTGGVDGGGVAASVMVASIRDDSSGTTIAGVGVLACNSPGSFTITREGAGTGVPALWNRAMRSSVVERTSSQ